MRDLYLASGSPRRAELLEQAGVPFRRLAAPDIDESPLPNEPPRSCVRRLAERKAEAGWSAVPEDARSNAVVLAADTLVVLEGQMLGKPADDDEARVMLRSLSGREHQVMTAVALRTESGASTFSTVTQVRFATLDGATIDRYVGTGEPADKAGAYGIQGHGAALVASVSGSYSGVVGLPLAETVHALADLGVATWQVEDISG